jgi:hypothetical protein
MRTFFETIRRSIFDPSFYQDLPSRSLGSAWGYYSGFSLLLAIAFTIALSLPIVPQIRPFLTSAEQVAINLYPDDLVLSLQGGVLSMNKDAPVTIPIPTFLRDAISEQDSATTYRSLIVIDPDATATIDTYRAYGTIIFLGKSDVIFPNDTGGIEVQSYGKEISGVFDEQDLRHLFDVVQPYYRFIAPLIVVLIAIGLLVAYGVKFAYLVLGAIAILVLGRMLGLRWTYGESYVIGLHAITLPVLIDSALLPFGLSLGVVPLLFTFVMLGVVFMNTKDISRSPLSATPPPPPPRIPATENNTPLDPQ